MNKWRIHRSLGFLIESVVQIHRALLPLMRTRPLGAYPSTPRYLRLLSGSKCRPTDIRKSTGTWIGNLGWLLGVGG